MNLGSNDEGMVLPQLVVEGGNSRMVLWYHEVALRWPRIRGINLC